MQRPAVKLAKTKVAGPYALSLNGTSDYVAIPNWTPKGSRYAVEVDYTVGDASTFQHLLGSTNEWRLQQLASGEVGVSYVDTGATTRSAGVSGVVDGQRVIVRAEIEPAQVTAYAMGQSDTNSNAPQTLPSPFNTIGARHDRTLRFTDGVIHGCRLIDRSAIQARYAMTGNDTMYGSLDSAIVMTGDLTIEWDLVRVDKSGTLAQAVLGCAGGNGCAIWMNDSSHTSANNIGWNINSNFCALNNVFAGVAQNQHCHVTLTRVGTTATAYIDGIQVATAACAGDDYTVDQFFRSGTASLLDNSTVANLRISNGDVQHYWPLNEATGNTATDVIGGNNITWTSVNREWFSSNNRQYLFTEGQGTTIHDLGAAQHGTASGGTWARKPA